MGLGWMGRGGRFMQRKIRQMQRPGAARGSATICPARDRRVTDHTKPRTGSAALRCSQLRGE